MSLKNKKILLIIGGGISAYKSLDLIRLLKKSNVNVKAILTRSGREFVTPLSITTLTKNRTFENIFDKKTESEIGHISLSRWADLIIVLPTTANFMTKLSIGKAEDLATTVLLASNKDTLLVPAMNVRMWLHKATQKNFSILQDYGYHFIGPEKGEMACGEYGEGKMSSPRQIFSYIKNYFNKKDIVKAKKFTALVTTGPTREYMDPIRYLSIESSGKQNVYGGKPYYSHIQGKSVILINSGSNRYSEVSPIEILKVALAVLGLKDSDSEMEFLIRSNACLISFTIFSATGVGTIPLEVLTKSSSSNKSLSLDKALLTAGCVIPRTSPAFVRFLSL